MKKSRKKYKKKYRKKGGSYNTYKRGLSPRKSNHKSIPTKSVAEAAAQLLKTKIGKHLDKKYENCALCLAHIMDKDKSIKLSCNPDKSKGHSFHKLCVKELKEKGHRKCPQCRVEVPELQVSRISIPNVAREKLQIIWDRGIFPIELIESNNIEQVVPKLITTFTPLYHTDDPAFVRTKINIQTDIFSEKIASYWNEIDKKLKIIDDAIYTKKKTVKKQLNSTVKKVIKELFLYIHSRLNIIKFFFQNIPQSLMEKITNLEIIPLITPLIPTPPEIAIEEEQEIVKMTDYIRR